MGVYQVGVPALGQFAAWCPSKIHATQRFGQMIFFELNCAGSICMQCMKEKKTRSPSAPHNAKRFKKDFLKKGGRGEERGYGICCCCVCTPRHGTATRNEQTTTTTRKHHAHPPQLKHPRAPAMMNVFFSLFKIKRVFGLYA